MIAVPVLVGCGSVRQGDSILIGGQAFTVTDMATLPRGGKRLHFPGGETFTMSPATILYATRRVTPEARGRRP
ncbi:hypothetical protein RM780_23825 [Streptomyces sp. DSM 44917]|uniref:Lipoprotein n=1 Tax=Streptomyces boetiae TaxID=3075541 RepID=A0ABU2LEE3_9ACTN|nr:hypothetical protein [Streptomyces sp. DSM 44917]MDT0309959.1 hypothetical protein [Streptomyces sp. DSM 44917]